MRNLLLCSVWALAVAAAGCSSDSNSGGTTSGDSLASARLAVVTKINQLRATASLPALTEWTAEESCVDGQAHTDAVADSAYKAFGTCGESAENECLDYPSTSAVTTGCIPQMWAEGPGDQSTHGHYLILSSTTYHKIAVGFATAPDGTTWAALDLAP